VAEKRAAVDLFISECIQRVGGSTVLAVPDAMTAYETWRKRHLADAPALTHPRTLGDRMKVAGFTARLAEKGEGGWTGVKGQYRPTVYVGALLTVEEEDTSTDRPATSEEEAPEWMQDPPASLERARARKASAKHEGDQPGREIPRDYREQIVLPLIAQGWTYYKTNGNGAGKPRLVSPDGRRYSLANTPSDHRGLLNAKSHLKTKLGAAL
jgi:hypothetical protein